MSDAGIRDGDSIERVVQLIRGTCRYCGCHGGECAIGGRRDRQLAPDHSGEDALQ